MSRRVTAAAPALALLAAFPANASALSPCRDPLPAPRVLLSTGDTLEYGAVDSAGRLFYSDTSKSAIFRVDRPGAPPALLTATPGDPGAFVLKPDRTMIVGIGDQVQNGLQGDLNPISSLWRVNLDAGAHTVYATGLGEANGLAEEPDGALYATNGVGRYVDRVLGGHVDHGWARVFSTNGVAVSPDNRYVYVDQTLAPAAVQRIPIADPGHITLYAQAQGADQAAGLDDMTIDARGRLFIAANEAGQIWRVDGPGRICLLASGLKQPSSVSFGQGAYWRNLYAVTFGGLFLEYDNVLPPSDRPAVRHRRRHRKPLRFAPQRVSIGEGGSRVRPWISGMSIATSSR
jgi:sugar lactone lactonase YvrE